MSWDVIALPEFEDWLKNQDSKAKVKIKAAVRSLIEVGPLLRRPLVGKIEGSRLSNLKELIPMSSDIRILFIFDNSRRAILLLGGDKSGDFQGWYKKHIPIAEARFERFMKEEGLR